MELKTHLNAYFNKVNVTSHTILHFSLCYSYHQLSFNELNKYLALLFLLATCFKIENIETMWFNLFIVQFIDSTVIHKRFYSTQMLLNT